ncbi:hypothetical protein ABPG72_017846 [Tetrahymena utriculariae]
MEQQNSSFYNLKDFNKSNLKALTSVDLQLKNQTLDDKQLTQLNNSLKKCSNLESLILNLQKESISDEQINRFFEYYQGFRCLMPTCNSMSNDQRYSHMKFLIEAYNQPYNAISIKHKQNEIGVYGNILKEDVISNLINLKQLELNLKKLQKDLESATEKYQQFHRKKVSVQINILNKMSTTNLIPYQNSIQVQATTFEAPMEIFEKIKQQFKGKGDFGAAKQFKVGSFTKNYKGGDQKYRAPEFTEDDLILRKKYDVFCLGLIILEMTMGRFLTKQEALQIRKGNLEAFISKKPLYTDLNNIIKSMLIIDQNQRINCEQLVQQLNQHKLNLENQFQNAVLGKVEDNGCTRMIQKFKYSFVRFQFDFEIKENRMDSYDFKTIDKFNQIKDCLSKRFIQSLSLDFKFESQDSVLQGRKMQVYSFKRDINELVMMMLNLYALHQENTIISKEQTFSSADIKLTNLDHISQVMLYNLVEIFHKQNSCYVKSGYVMLVSHILGKNLSSTYFDMLSKFQWNEQCTAYQNAKYLNKNHYKNSQDEVNLMQQIQILMQQGQANNSNQINQLNQTIIQQKQQIQSLDGQVKQLHQEISKRETQNQQMNDTNISLKQTISSLEVKLQEFMQKPQQNNTYKFEPQQTQMKMNQQIQQIQPQQVAITWKPVFFFANNKIKYLKV